MSYIGYGGDVYYRVFYPQGVMPPAQRFPVYNGSGNPVNPPSFYRVVDALNPSNPSFTNITFNPDPGPDGIVFVNPPEGCAPVRLFRTVNIGDIFYARNVIDGTLIAPVNGIVIPEGAYAPPIEELGQWHSTVHTDGLPIWIKDEPTHLPPEGNTPMSNNVIKLKRRLTGEAGAPVILENAELAFNEVSQVLYYGLGSDNDGNAVNIIPIGGRGAYLNVDGDQTVIGIKTFSGELHVNVPVNINQAANKYYVDTQIAQKVAEAITAVFKYRGTLSASTNTLPVNPVQGDLYRVTTEGNFAGATPFVVSVGDHVVFNGVAWDKIDNTDPAISNTDGKITVTRNGEDSYVINLAEEWNGGTQITRLGTILEGVWNASIIALNYGGTGADLSNAPDGTLFKKMGSAFVPAVVGIDFVKTNYGTINGGTF